MVDPSKSSLMWINASNHAVRVGGEDDDLGAAARVNRPGNPGG
jgi:hypothetical protein